MINSPQGAPAQQVNKARPLYSPSYNAVQINMDTPTVNAPQPGYYYDYPTADGQPYYPPVQQPVPQPAPAPQQPVSTPQQPAPKAEVPAPEVETKPVDEKPAEAPKQEVNIDQVVANLSDPDFDKQALQMDEIAKKGMTNEADATPYVQEDVFNKLIDIIDYDSSKLDGPTQEQLELRAKLAENDAVAEQAKNEGKDPSTVALPHQLTDDQIALATKITPLEQAERNKEYALFTMAILQKTYGDEIEKRSGNVVPLTDLPAAAQVVSELKENPNPAIRTAAIDSLRYIKRPEYKEDLSKLFTIAKSDADETVALAADEALKSLDEAPKA